MAGKRSLPVREWKSVDRLLQQQRSAVEWLQPCKLQFKRSASCDYKNYYKGTSVFDTAAFSDPGFAPGNSPRNVTQLRAPFSSNENLAVAQHFYAGEPINMELRMELFNVLNREQICTPDNTVTDGANNFGLVQPNGVEEAAHARQIRHDKGKHTSRCRSNGWFRES